MKKFLTIIISGLLWCHSASADDIADFEIEGISIGDSLLSHLSVKEIKTVGEFKVVLNLHSEIESSIKIKVVPEELVK